MKTRGAICALLLLAWTGNVFGSPVEDQYAVAARHYEQGRWEAAASEFQTFLARFASDKRAPSVRFFLGECFVQLRQYQAAYDVFSKLKAETQASEYQSQIEFRVGESAYLMGDVKRAMPLIDQFTQAHPDDKMCQYALPYLGDMALANGNFELAKSSYSEALKRFPDGPLHDECRFGLGRAFEASKETDEALRFYSFLAEFKNKSLADDALLRMGVLKYDTGERQEAIQLLKQIVEEFPNSELRSRTQPLSWSSPPS